MSKLAVSCSPRPWIDVFALPEKSNMTVIESDPDPKIRKMPITFNDCATFELSMRECNWNATDSKKNYFWPDYSTGSLIYDRPKKCPTIFCAVNLWVNHWG